MAGALDGLVVLDLTTHLSGPFCGMQLADLGADVIKIESPQGDSMRGAPPFVEGEGAPFMLWNRNKRGIVLDLKDADDLEIFWDLVDGADVVLENFRPGVMKRLGIGWDGAARAQSAADPGLDLGLRPDRPLCQARRLRSHDPGDVGPDVGDRAEGRPALPHSARHLRCRRRPLPHHRRAGGPAGAAEDRARASGSRPRCSRPRCRWASTRPPTISPTACGRRSSARPIAAPRPTRCSRPADGWLTIGGGAAEFLPQGLRADRQARAGRRSALQEQRRSREEQRR